MAFKMKMKMSYKAKGKRKRPKGQSRLSVKKMIRREISRNNENKSRQAYFNNWVPGPSSLAAAVWNGQNVIPVGVGPGAITIDQGVGAGQRIGNRVKTKSLRFKGTIMPMPYSAVFNDQPIPVQVKMLILYDRKEPTATPQPFTNLFQLGNAVQQLQNSLTDMWAPINGDRYRVLATRTFKLGHAAYVTPSDAYQTNGQRWYNNDFKMNCNFNLNLTKHYPQTVRFDDNSVDPVSRGIYCALLFCAADGTFIASDNVPIRVQYMLDYHYEDA